MQQGTRSGTAFCSHFSNNLILPCGAAVCPPTPAAEAYEGDQLRQLVAALCPTIYGHELVKAGLLLSMFGGVRKHSSSSNRVSVNPAAKSAEWHGVYGLPGKLFLGECLQWRLGGFFACSSGRKA